MSEDQLGDGPIEKEFREKMRAVGEALDGFFNDQIGGPGRSVGFVVLTFKFGEANGRCNFISNGADRKDIVVLFREMIARFEGQPEMEGNA